MANKQRSAFVVTKEHIQNARSYIPLDDKCVLAKEIAKKCVVLPETDEKSKSVLQILTPEMKTEDIALKQLCLMNVFLTEYLRISVKSPFDEKEYDYYAGSHIMNQVERFKNDYNLKDKIYDMVCDYKEFKKIVDTEIYNEKMIYNDGVSRVMAVLAAFSSKEDIEKLKEGIAALKEKIGEIESEETVKSDG